MSKDICINSREISILEELPDKILDDDDDESGKEVVKSNQARKENACKASILCILCATRCITWVPAPRFVSANVMPVDVASGVYDNERLYAMPK